MQFSLVPGTKNVAGRVVAAVALAIPISLATSALAAGAGPTKKTAAVVRLVYGEDELGVKTLEISPKRVVICQRNAATKDEYCPTSILWIVESKDWTAEAAIDEISIEPDKVQGVGGKDLFDASYKISNLKDNYNAVEAELKDKPKYPKKTPKGTPYEMVSYKVTAKIGGVSYVVDPDIIIKEKPGG